MDFDKTTIDEKTKVTGCIKQFFRPKYNIPMDGTGNCKTCTYDPVRNLECKGYYPITMHRITMVDRVEIPVPQVLEIEAQYQS